MADERLAAPANARTIDPRMDPDVAAAVERLRRDGVLEPQQALLLGRAARGELVSIRPELRLLLYAGVLTLMSGVGLLVRQNLEHIGPLAIALTLWLAAAGATLWALRHAPPFSWGQAPDSHMALDYVLLLGVLLTAAALAYTEVYFTPLGPAWSTHLLVMSVFAGALAARCDSRLVASIALSSFAAWRGVSASLLERSLWGFGAGESAVRVNALLTGALFVALGWALVRSDRKPHFEPVASHLGWLLVLGALASGLGEPGAAKGYRLALLLVGSALALAAFRSGRFSLFGFGLIAAYVGLSVLVVEGLREEALYFLWFSSTGVLVLVGLLLAHRAMRRPA